MRKIVFRKNTEANTDERLHATSLLTPLQRFKKVFALMTLASMFKKGPIKLPQGLGVVLKRTRSGSI